jgi:hypothetical protein
VGAAGTFHRLLARGGLRGRPFLFGFRARSPDRVVVSAHPRKAMSGGTRRGSAWLWLGPSFPARTFEKIHKERPFLLEMDADAFWKNCDRFGLTQDTVAQGDELVEVGAGHRVPRRSSCVSPVVAQA